MFPCVHDWVFALRDEKAHLCISSDVWINGYRNADSLFVFSFDLMLLLNKSGLIISYT